MEKEHELMDKIVSLCKRRGFVYQGSEIYGGLAGTWDYGPLGVSLKKNIKDLWWRAFVESREDMYGIDAAILMNSKVWEATGHVATFADPLVEDVKTKKRYRADHILEENGLDSKGMTVSQMDAEIKAHKIKSPDGNNFGDVRQFNMMFSTKVGAMDDSSATVYLRPETAQGMFVNFKNVIDSFHPKLPFGLAQIGKAFRNEITPRDFIFRLRELEQMEIEYFIRPEMWEEQFTIWLDNIKVFLVDTLGLNKDHIHEHEHSEEERSFYSKKTVDLEFDYPFGQKELYGLAYRTDYDLSKHSGSSGVALEYLDEQESKRFTPHVIEPAVGLDRTFLAVICDAYTEDMMGEEKRAYLKFKPSVAPVKVAVFPLLKNKPELVNRAREVYLAIKKEIPSAMFDDNGNIGKRYRRQDEIGTPFCITVDFDTLADDTVTLRDRDSGKQERVKISDLVTLLKSKI